MQPDCYVPLRLFLCFICAAYSALPYVHKWIDLNPEGFDTQNTFFLGVSCDKGRHFRKGKLFITILLSSMVIKCFAFHLLFSLMYSF